MKPKKTLEILKRTFQECSEDKASCLAADLAYYTNFSLTPLLLIIAIASLDWVDDIVQSMIMTQIGYLFGEGGTRLIASMIENASNLSTSLIAAILGLVTLLFSALGIFGELQSALNPIWELKPKPVIGFVNSLKHLIVICI